mgnify:FL=1
MMEFLYGKCSANTSLNFDESFIIETQNFIEPENYSYSYGTGKSNLFSSNHSLSENKIGDS